MVLLLFFMVCVTSAYQFMCPDKSHRHFRVTTFCPNISSQYTCLYDENKKAYDESCVFEPDWVPPGQKYVITGALNNKYCSPKRYQPFKFWSNADSDCIFLKSECNELGQVKSSNGSVSKDVSCGCNLANGYVFVNKRENACECNPLNEDCSCYSKPCPENTILLSDSTCSQKGQKVNIATCPPVLTQPWTDQISTVSLIRNMADYKEVYIRAYSPKVVVWLITFTIAYGVVCLLLLKCHNVNQELYEYWIHICQRFMCTNCNNQHDNYHIEPRVVTVQKGNNQHDNYHIEPRVATVQNGNNQHENYQIKQQLQNMYNLSYVFMVKEFEIYDIQVLDDRLLVISDFQKLVIYNKNGECQREIYLPVDTKHIAVIDNNTVAVTSNTKIAIVDVRQGQVIRYFDVKAECYSITYRNNQLFVGCIDEIINVMNIFGEVTRTIPVGVLPWYIYVGETGSIYYTNWEKLFCINADGDELFTLPYSETSVPCGLTTHDAGHVLVLCDESNNVLRISPDGKQNQVMSQVPHIPDHKPTICYDLLSELVFIGRKLNVFVFKRNPNYNLVDTR